MSSRLGRETLGIGAIALISLVLSGYVAVRSERRDASRSATAANSSCYDGDARQELDRLRRELEIVRDQGVARVEDRVSALESRPVSSVAGSTPAAAIATRSARRTYTRFTSGNGAIQIGQAQDGSLSVKNTNPSLTGKLMVVEGTTSDGQIDQLTIVVPEPGK